MNKQFRMTPEGFDTSIIKSPMGFTHTTEVVGEKIKSAISYNSKKDPSNFVTQVKTDNHSLAISAEQWKGSGLPEEIDADEWQVSGVNPFKAELVVIAAPVVAPAKKSRKS